MSNPSISLLAFSQNDFDKLIAWAVDAETLMQFAGPSFNFPLTSEQLESALADEKRFCWSIVCNSEQQVIGHAEIYLQDAGTAFLCRLLIGDPVHRGKGYGLQVINQLLERAFNIAGMEEAALNVFDWNLPAIKCYRKAGFVINHDQAKIRQVNEQVWTVLTMRLHKKNWKLL